MRKLIIKIAIALCLITLAVGVTHLFKYKINNNSSDAGTVTITLEDLNGKTETKTVSYKENEVLFDVLEREYTIRYESTSYGATLYDIDWITTDFKTAYIAVYVNDSYSNYGISSLKMENGMKILLKETKI